MQTIILNTGVPMPVVGLGTWKSEPKKVGQTVEYAFIRLHANRVVLC